jgi:hypothetical protein
MNKTDLIEELVELINKTPKWKDENFDVKTMHQLLSAGLIGYELALKHVKELALDNE